MSGEIGYYTDIAEAESYFAEERLETVAWDALSDGSVSGTKDEKTACLKQAFNRILSSPDFILLPDPSAATATQLLKLKPAQAEMAYYLAQHLGDEDRRKGLQAQGVSAAGGVKETYDKDHLDTIPIPPAVRALLQPWSAVSDVPFYAVNIDRDEDKDVHEDVTDL
jgi:hypothetical protein